MAQQDFRYGLKRLSKLLLNRIYLSRKHERDIADEFHKLYYDSHIFGKTWADTYWLGVPALKCPLDLWVYQEIIYRLKPDAIVECGTSAGGGALFLASICDLVDKGEVITIDIEKKSGRPQHKRIQYLLGSSTSDAIVNEVEKLISNKRTVIVILDSDHHEEHVLRELNIYRRFVSVGSYLIVEDTNMNGHPVAPDFGPGPMEAVLTFLKEHPDFEVDQSAEKFYLSFNPNGYLKRIN